MILNKHQIIIAILSVFIFSCSKEQTDSKSQVVQDETMKNSTLDSLKKAVFVNAIKTDSISLKDTCSCKKYSRNVDFHNIDLIVDGRNIDSLKYWGSNKTMSVKSLEINGIGTFSDDFKVFKNVETLIVGHIDWRNTSGLDNFPKLKNIFLLGKTIDLSSSPKWLENIEVFKAEKSIIIGLKSFKQLPNLRRFDVAFTTLQDFPSDFETLQCLSYFSTGSYLGNIDLSQIDVSHMPCLEFLRLHSWRKNLKGLPKGLEKVPKFNVLHDNLTKEDRAYLKRIKAK